jgi:hypothetical protein
MPPETIQLVVDSEQFCHDFFGKTTVADGAQASSDQATFTLTDYTPAKQFGMELILTVTVALGKDIAIAVVAEWLVDKLKHSTRHVRHRGVVYDVDVAGMKRLLKQLKAEHKDS